MTKGVLATLPEQDHSPNLSKNINREAPDVADNATLLQKSNCTTVGNTSNCAKQSKLVVHGPFQSFSSTAIVTVSTVRYQCIRSLLKKEYLDKKSSTLLSTPHKAKIGRLCTPQLIFELPLKFNY